MARNNGRGVSRGLAKVMVFLIVLVAVVFVVDQAQVFRPSANILKNYGSTDPKDDHIQSFDVTAGEIKQGQRKYDIAAKIVPKTKQVNYVDFYYKVGVPATKGDWVSLGRLTRTSNGVYAKTVTIPYNSSAGHWTITANVRYADNSWCTGNPAYPGKYAKCTGTTHRIMVGPTPGGVDLTSTPSITRPPTPTPL